MNEVESAQWSVLAGLYSALNSAEELSEESVEVRFRAAAAMFEIFQRTEGLNANGSVSAGFSIPSAVEIHSVLHEVSSQFSETGYAAPAFWTGIWATEVLHTHGAVEAALNYLYFEATSPYDEISEMVHDRFICQMQYETEVELPSYEEWSMQVLFCDGSIADSEKSKSSDDSDEKKQTEGLSVKAFPNPTAGQLFLELSNTYREVKIALYDLNGRILEQFNKVETGSIDVSFLESGLYLMRVSQGDQSEQVRISIIK